MKNKRIIETLLSFLPLCGLFSCDNASTSSSNEYAKNFVLEYVLNPGNYITYNEMWEGKVYWNDDSAYQSNRTLYTYLLNYREKKNDFYFVYVKENCLSSLREYASTYLDSESRSYKYNNVQFNMDENIVDGKYVLAAQKLENDCMMVVQSNDIESQKFKRDGYQLALCLEGTSVTIEQNASVKKSINKNVTMFEKIELIWDEESGLKREEEPNASYVGEKLEVYPTGFENMDCLYSPVMGFANTIYCQTVTAEIHSEGVLLPRLMGGIDLLSDDSKLNKYEDVYCDYKNEFLDAFLGYAEEYSSGNNKYAYFDTQKVLNILK